MADFFAFWTDVPQGAAFPNFGVCHVLAILAITVVIICALIGMRRMSPRGIRRVICTAAIVEPLLEISHMIWLYQVGQTDLVKLLPLHLCTMQMFLIPLAVFTRRQILREFVFFTSFIGGCLAILWPMGVSDTYPFFHFQTLQTFLLHGLLIFIPLAMLLFEGLRPQFRNLPKLILMFIVLVIPAAAVDWIFGENYMFLNQPPDVAPLVWIFEHLGRGAYLGFYFLFLCMVCCVLYLPFELARKAGKDHPKLHT